MCLFTSARTVEIVFARSAGSEAMYCAGVLTFDGGFMDSSSSRTKCISERLKTSQRQEAGKPNAVTAMNTKLVTPTRAVFASADMVFNPSLPNSEPVQDRMNSYCGVVYRALSQK